MIVLGLLLPVIGLIAALVALTFPFPANKRAGGQALLASIVGLVLCINLLLFAIPRLDQVMNTMPESHNGETLTSWNTDDLNSRTNGNIAFAANTLAWKLPYQVRNKAVDVPAAKVMKDPRSYFGRSCRFRGTAPPQSVTRVRCEAS
jgi:hypothetical protein